MLKTTLSLLSSAFLAVSAHSYANEPFPYLDATATIDGKLDEAVWQQAKK